MERKHLILIAAWVAYLLFVEACLLIHENYKPKIRHGNKKKTNIAKAAKWTGIVGTVITFALTVKQILF